MAWAQSHDGKLGLDSASTQSTSFQPDSSSSEQTRPRSPHTYRRANSDHHDVQPSKADPLQNGRLMSSGYNRKWARTPRTSSDSGTDADDERTGLLKGLPAAPARPRKGLRVQHAAESDNEEVVLWPPSRSSWALFFRSPSPKPLKTNNATSSSYDSNSMTRRVTVRRRHAGVVHRLIETALLGSVAGIVFLREDVRSLALSWRRGLCTYISLLVILYAACPIRVSFWRRCWPRVSFSLTIPTSFDPAPLLYPTIIPVLVALSLTHFRPALVLPNIVLGLSSVPPSVIPAYDPCQSLSPVHWFITAIPIVFSEHAIFSSTSPTPLSLRNLDSELLLLLYPLHRTLILVLDSLVKTSLLPAELQLLGTALINLFLFAISPQAKILKALLWLGGTSVLVICGEVLTWEVTLARVPTWKFRRKPKHLRTPKGILNSIDHRICETLDWLVTSAAGGTEPGSDSDEQEDFGTCYTETRSKPFHRHRSSNSNSSSKSDGTKSDGLWPGSWASTKQFLSFSQQRDTTSAVDDADSARPSDQLRTTSRGRRKRSMPPGLASFLSLTSAQARVRRWLYAAYIFAATTLIIDFLVRKFVASEALHGIDPFGWALGYLFGNIPSFRLWVVMLNLEQWIALPQNRGDGHLSCSFGWVEHLRRDTFGEASTRLLVSAYCVVVLIVGMAIVLKLSQIAEVDTRRKVFHGMMVQMFLPVTYVDPTFVSLAYSLVLAIFLLLDLFRALQVPPIAKPLTYFLAPYTDGRDHRGPVIVSHIFLLIGCAIPLWLSLADLPRTGEWPWAGWDVLIRNVGMVSGVVCVGIGDAAASLVGRRYGRLKWFWGGDKSLEGSVAFALSVFTGLILARVWLTVGGWYAERVSWMLVVIKSILAAGGASVTEAVLTGGNDNVIVPVVLWLLVRGLNL